MNQIHKRRIQITLETHSITIIRTRGGEPIKLAHCTNCLANVAGFQHSYAALIFRVACAELERLSQSRQIHSVENGDLCGNSLAAFFSREIRCVED